MVIEKLKEKILKILNDGREFAYNDKADKILALFPTWISVEERLPEIGQMVVLMDINRYANNGELKVDNEHVVQAGYLNEFRTKYWSVYGERSLCLDAFTHWQPLPSPPKEGE